MKQTILTILTDPSVRQATPVANSLSQEYSAGEPWFDEV